MDERDGEPGGVPGPETFEQSLERTREIARGFEGLGEADACVRAALYADVDVQFVPEGGVVTADLRTNRIRLWMRDGVVVSAGVG